MCFRNTMTHDTTTQNFRQLKPLSQQKVTWLNCSYMSLLHKTSNDKSVSSQSQQTSVGYHTNILLKVARQLQADSITKPKVHPEHLFLPSEVHVSACKQNSFSTTAEAGVLMPILPWPAVANNSRKNFNSRLLQLLHPPLLQHFLGDHFLFLFFPIVLRCPSDSLGSFVEECNFFALICSSLWLTEEWQEDLKKHICVFCVFTFFFTSVFVFPLWHLYCFGNHLKPNNLFLICCSLPPLLSLFRMWFSPWSWDVGGGVGSVRKKLVKGDRTSCFFAGSPSGQHVVLPHIWLPVGSIGLRVAASPWATKSNRALQRK